MYYEYGFPYKMDKDLPISENYSLNETFDIDITPADLIPENFNSAEAMWNMIQKLQ